MGKITGEIIGMGKSGGDINYKKSGTEGLDDIAELWKKLRQHHKERSTYFSEQIDKMKWEERKSGLLEKTRKGAILVESARDNDKLIGYCISSVNETTVGEIESIYIEKEYRNHHIGDHFMNTALAWMDGLGVKRKIIGVAVGNEEAFGFYQKYGFYPRMTTLQQK